MTLSQIARTYLGFTEKPGNSGFNDAVFEGKMKDTEWQKGQAWCSYFGELCAVETHPAKKDKLEALCHGSAVQTAKNFQKAGFELLKEPEPDCFAIWQVYVDGVADWTGHLGLTETVTPLKNGFTSIEGNTNDKGGREGYIVAIHSHPVTFTVPKKGRHQVLLGFIRVADINKIWK